MRSPQQRDRLDAVQIDIEAGPISTWLSTELKASSRAGDLHRRARCIKAVANHTLVPADACAN